MRRLAMFLLALTFPAALVAGHSKNPWVGTWKLNVAKSQYGGGPGLQSETIVIGADGKVTVTAVNTGGQPVIWSYTYSEGREVPITGMENSTVIEKRTRKTMEQTWKMPTASSTGKGVLSKDGKVLTYTLDGTDTQGHHQHDVLVFEKQAS